MKKNKTEEIEFIIDENNKVDFRQVLQMINMYEEKIQKKQAIIDKAIEYINKYAWQEDIIGGIYTTTGKPAIDRYMQLEWDNCNELLDILKEAQNEKN